MKNYYYIGVNTTDGMKFVTGIDRGGKMAHWDVEKAPLAMRMSTADDIAFGLRCNGYWAVTVKSPIEIEQHFVARR